MRFFNDLNTITADNLRGGFFEGWASPLIEVLPSHRGDGIGSELMRRLLEQLDGLYMIDVMCDEDVFPFYEHFGFQRAGGGIIRNYEWRRTAAASPAS